MAVFAWFLLSAYRQTRPNIRQKCVRVNTRNFHTVLWCLKTKTIYLSTFPWNHFIQQYVKVKCFHEIFVNWNDSKITGFHAPQCGKTKKLVSLTKKKKFRQINSLVISLAKVLLSRNFCQKCERLNPSNFQFSTVHCAHAHSLGKILREIVN